MSVYTHRDPEYGIRCDVGCGTTFRRPATAQSREASGRSLRREAADRGWRVRPETGKGCKKVKDVCPSCRAELDV
jgi:hypothetical protein